MLEQQCDILIIGGGLGGVAAALKATSKGAKVIMTEETLWVGGQMTSQGVSCLDEHPIIEIFGGTSSYYDMRSRIRQFYQTNYILSGKAKDDEFFNPGSSGKRICFEPKVGVEILNDMLKPSIEKGLLEIYYLSIPIEVYRRQDEIEAVTILFLETQKKIKILPKYVIDATELGDLLPLAQVPYRTGVESFVETREPSAPNQSIPKANQGFTFPFAVEWCPGESHTISKPELYEEMKEKYPFTFNGLKMFEAGRFKNTFWAYRRILDAQNFNDSKIKRDVSIINWKSNDYHEETIIDQPQEIKEKHLYRAKQLSLSFLYWLQTEAPRDEGGYGYPELKLRADVMGTKDGLSHYPYIREARRIMSMNTIKEQDIVFNYNAGSRSRVKHDSIGLGTYFYVDIHPCSYTKERSGSGQPIRPFQIPLGALLTDEVSNFIAGAKNIGSTHITNGTCRLHPIEWNIGEAAGSIAAYSLKEQKKPIQIYENKSYLREFQLELLSTGIPLFWFRDLPLNHENFIAVQYLALEGIISYSTTDLYFHPDKKLNEKDVDFWIIGNRRIRFSPKVIDELKEKAKKLNRSQFAQHLFEIIRDKNR
ncbi:FAD-dependent oxidoreductase [Priestia sp. RMT2NF4]|uniref:FAD-dependent oxidoreductase n=1 Tax=Priestia sp. RMT2NF4 TaxID=3398394 RepID=UPI003A4C6E4A